MPEEILITPCETNSIATWLEAKQPYRPSRLLHAWDAITTSFRKSFPDKFFNVPIIPIDTGQGQYPFPEIDKNGCVYSPPVQANDVSGYCLNEGPIEDQDAHLEKVLFDLLELASRKFPGHLIVEFENLDTSHPASPTVVQAAETFGTMTGFMTNNYFSTESEEGGAPCSGGFLNHESCPDSAHYLGLVEKGIYPQMSPPNRANSLRSQYIEVFAPDVNTFPDAIWQAHVELTDYTPPVTTAVISGPFSLNDWYRGPVIVNFTATDDLSGVVKMEVSSDNGSTWTTENSLSLTSDGIYTLLFHSTDVAGSVETPKSMTVKIDSTPPVITAIAKPPILKPATRPMVQVTVSGKMTDNLSSVNPKTAVFSVKDEYGTIQPNGPVKVKRNGAYSFGVLLEARHDGQDLDGRLYTITVSAEDNAGNTDSALITVVVRLRSSP